MAFDANDSRKVKARDRRAKLAARQAGDDMAALMKLPAFRRFVHDRLTRCHIWTPSYQQGDPVHTAFQEGERNVGLQLFADCEGAAPAETATMIAEATNAKAQEKAVQTAEDTESSTEDE